MFGRLVFFFTLLLASAARGQDAAVFDNLEFRAIGPASMGGRITDIEGVPGDPNVVFVASASGGLWKTTNGGVTWTPIFERQGTISIGDIALDPRNPDVIWVGTGEANPRNSVSFGDGVYKSTDGGKTWQHLGLQDTRHISRIIVNPHSPEVAWVAALGHVFGPNEERGVFLTADGGKSWRKTLYIDAQHGIADLDVDPANPNIVYAAAWRFERKPWGFTSGSERGGIFRSIDAGRTWKKLENGLPKLLGRVAVKVAPSNPQVVYVMAESSEGTLYRSSDRGDKFQQMSKQVNLVARGFYYTDLRVDPADEDRVYAVASLLQVSIDGGKTFRRISNKTHVDYHALWIDSKDPRRLWQGQDGGTAVSYDRSENWEYVNNMPLGQFYQVHADTRLPFYWLSGGLQDNGTWTGPSRTREPAGILNNDWHMISFGDGFHVVNHPDNPELYVSESQGGSILRTDLSSREQQSVSPQPRSGLARELKYRFNWNAPIILSPHDKNTLYFGANVVFKSTDFGQSWQPISPDLTTNDPEKLKDAGGPAWVENTTAENHCTVISLAESPVQPGLVWAGTDDGNLQVAEDGKSWTNMVRNVPGLSANSPVSHVEPSRTAAATAYASFDRHMLDDLRPYVYKTTNLGKSWTNITGNLPESAYVWVIREDPKNPKLLYAGTELGLYVSWTGGESWQALQMKNLPVVAVHDIQVHARENDLILGTHGRGVWIFDDATALQKLSAGMLNDGPRLLPIRPALRYTSRFMKYGIGNKVFAGPNPPYGAIVTYYLKDKPDDKTPVKLEVLDGAGKVIREIEKPPREKGLNRSAWDLRYGAPRMRRPPTEEETEFGGGPRGPRVLPGTYTVRLTVGGKSVEQPVEVRLDSTITVSSADLKAQHDDALRLRDMQSAVADALRALDSVKDQLTQLEKTVKDRLPEAPKELLDALADHKKQAEALEDRLERPRDLPPKAGTNLSPRLGDKVGGLFGRIDGPNAAPTPYMREVLGELEPEFRNQIGEVNAFLTQALANLNDRLRQQGVPTLLAGKPVDLPR